MNGNVRFGKKTSASSILIVPRLPLGVLPRTSSGAARISAPSFRSAIGRWSLRIGLRSSFSDGMALFFLLLNERKLNLSGCFSDVSRD